MESTPYLLPNTQGRYVTVKVTETSGEVYRINDDGTRTIYADYFIENGNSVIEASTFASEEFQRNIAEGSQGYRQTIGNSILEANGTPSPQTQTPNPDQQGGSTPAAPTPTNTAPPAAMFKYPIKMDDGQDRIVFTPLELEKSEFGVGDRIRLKKPTYKRVPNSTPMFIGIQGSITDQNAVTWGAGELNEIQRKLVNTSLSVMSEGMDAVSKAIDRFSKNLAENNNGLANNLKGLGQLYLAEQATGTTGLQARATGTVLNPNLELLFQGPELRTFQFQFKFSPRSKDEADIVRKIIREFKRNMAVKSDGNLFLKAPNVFKIQYFKGSSNIHKSINLIKVCALLNFAVDYTPNGSYMTFGGGDNGDPEASMVTYNVSMAFQEIEPIYDKDYEGEYEYGDGTKAPANHLIGF